MSVANSIVLGDGGFGTLGVGLAITDTALSFTAGQGARFPIVSVGQILSCCILNANNVIEEVNVTAHASGSDSATIVRACGATTAKVWNAGDRIEERLSSDVLRRLQQDALIATSIATGDGGATYTGTMAPAPLDYVAGMVYSLTLSTTNSGATPTIALNGLSALTVVLDGGGSLLVGHMPINGLYKFDGTHLVLLNPSLFARGQTLQTTAVTDVGSTTTSLSFTNLNMSNVNITPKSAASHLLIEVTFLGEIGNVIGFNAEGFFQIYDVTNAVLLGSLTQIAAVSSSGGNGWSGACALRALVANAVTSSRAFQLQGMTNNASAILTGEVMVWSITEIKD